MSPFLLSLLACQTDASNGEPTQAKVAETVPVDYLGYVVEGTPLAAGIVNLVNAATFSQLHDGIGINSQAAENLLSYRTRWSLDTVADVDRVDLVGPATLRDLAHYVMAYDLAPKGADYLGTYDGVDFTAQEAERVVAYINQADYLFLDDVVGLTSTTVDSITEQRPIGTAYELSKLYFMGTANLNAVLQYVTTLEAGLCRTDVDCASENEFCVGVPYDGSADFGKCIRSDETDFSEMACSLSEPCPAEEACLGAHVWDDGWCIADWMADTFIVNTPMDLQDGATVSSANLVTGLATVPVDIVVRLQLEHADPSEVTITLESPNGDIANVWAVGGSRETEIVVRGIPSDDAANGRYTLTVEDAAGGQVGTLHSWEMYITSIWD